VRTNRAVNRLLVLNKLRWHLRLPIKWAVFALTVLAVCFPYPGLLVRHIQHWRDPNALVEPDAPAIQPLVDELRPHLRDDLPPRDALKRVERYVCNKIPYEWDWNTWGVADYLPTVAEVLQMGKEDCDGRAVVAASLLRNFGFNAQLVTDFAHVWVKTDRGEIMGPGKKKAVIATERGPRLQLSGLTELPKALAHGAAVFPLVREAILIGVLWLLLLRPGGGIVCSIGGLACFVSALFCLRSGGRDYYHPVVWLQLVGLVGIVAGLVLLLVGARHRARTAERTAAPGAANCSAPQGTSL